MIDINLESEKKLELVDPHLLFCIQFIILLGQLVTFRNLHTFETFELTSDMSVFDANSASALSMKLPESPHLQEASPILAVISIQRWFRSFKNRVHLKERVTNALAQLGFIAEAIVTLKSSKSFEKSQRDLFGEKFAKSLTGLVDLIPHRSSASSKINQAFITKTKKAVVSALIISRFPDHVLYSEEFSVEEQPYVTKNCHKSAIVLTSSVYKFVMYAAAKGSAGAALSPKCLDHLLHSLEFSLLLFTRSFDAWQTEDSQRMARSLEDSFIEGYSALIACKYSVYIQHADPALLRVTETQLEKLREVMGKMMGQQVAQHRMEELCASIEASMMVIYNQVRNFEEAHGHQHRKERSNSNSSNHGATSSSSTASGTSTTSSSSSGSGGAAKASPSKETTATGSEEKTVKVAAVASPVADHSASQTTGDNIVLGATGTSGGDTAGDGSGGNNNNKVAMRYLEKLSQLTGLDAEQLAHEMTLDKFYRLPIDKHSPEESENSTSSTLLTPDGKLDPAAVAAADPSSIALLLKRQLLSSLADKMVNSLRTSSVDTVEHLQVGQTVPVRFAPNSYDHDQISALTSASTTGEERMPVPPVLSARITSIHYPASPVVPEENEKHEKGDVAVERSTVNNDRAPVTIDVEYLFESNLKEQGVSVQRVVLARHTAGTVLDSSIFLAALQDLCVRIAAFTPSRADLISDLFTHVDLALLQQIIHNRAADPVRDLLPVLQYLQRALLDLQAPSRAPSTQQWIDSLAESFVKKDNTSGSSESSSSSGKSFDEVVPLLPLFFERANDVIEEIQRDMANFYIAALVPTMQTHGALFLSRKFQHRLQTGATSLDATASLLAAQIKPATNFAATVADIVEAGACPPEGFAVAQLVVAPTSAPVTGNRVGLVRAVVARAFLSLLQVPVRLDSRQAFQAKILPETLAMDASRLAALRDAVDKIALECSVVITSRQLLSQHYRAPFKENEEVELQHRLDVLLSERDASLASIAAEVVKYIKYALYRHREIAGAAGGNSNSHISNSNSAGSSMGTRTASTPTAILSDAYSSRSNNSSDASSAASGLMSPVSAVVGANYDLKDLQTRVQRTLQDVVAPGNPVLSLFTKRLYKILLRALLNQPYQDRLAPYSLQSRGQERNLTLLVSSAVKLFTHSFNVHGELYGAILSSTASADTA